MSKILVYIKLLFFQTILNTYRTAVSPTLYLLCHEDFNVGRSEVGTFLANQRS